MFRSFFTLLLTAGIPLWLMTETAFAGTPSKGLKIDPMLLQAITKTAEPETQEPEETDTDNEFFAESMFWDWEPEQPGPEPPPPAGETGPFPTDRHRFTWPDEPGFRLGGILFLPSLLLRGGWDDNIFAEDTGKESDYVNIYTPRLRIEIPDIRHDIAFEGSWESIQYFGEDNENQDNIRGELKGALNAAGSLSVPFGFRWALTHERRDEDLTRQMPDSPLRRDDFAADGGIRFKPGAFGVALLGHYRTERFENGEGKFTNLPVVRSDADRDITQLEFNTSFDFDPENTLILWGTIGKRDYERGNYQAGGFNGPNRSSATFSGMMSWLFDYSGLNGHVSFGRTGRNYEDTGVQDVRIFVGDMEINHDIGALTNINLQFARSLEEDPEILDPLIRSRLGFYLDHQPWEEILVAGGADYNYLEFKNTGRDDETWDFRALIDYFINDYLAFGAEYIYTIRDSEMTGLDFHRNMVLLRGRGRL